jgi:DNA polymerase-3 subunit delta'
MPFSEVIAQERAVLSLRAALRRGALHHAYLFGGPRGAGKRATALLLAQAANCEGGAPGPGGLREDACGACGPCRKIARGVHPDVLVLEDERTMAKAGRWEPKGGRTPSRDVVVDQVRDLVDHRLALRRAEARRRFVVVDPADAMNPQAQNALLKTLEEPPPDTTLVLVAENADALLPTIRSRCLRVPFVAPAAEVAPRARAAVRAAAALDPGDPLGWLEFARTLGDPERRGKDRGPDREEAAEACEALATWLRDVLAAQAGGGTPALPDLADATAAAAAALPPAEVLRRRDEALRTRDALARNASPVLALERMLVGWLHGVA